MKLQEYRKIKKRIFNKIDSDLKEAIEKKDAHNKHYFYHTREKSIEFNGQYYRGGIGGLNALVIDLQDFKSDYEEALRDENKFLVSKIKDAEIYTDNGIEFTGYEYEYKMLLSEVPLSTKMYILKEELFKDGKTPDCVTLRLFEEGKIDWDTMMLLTNTTCDI